MNMDNTKAAFTAAWVVAMVAIAYLANTTSASGWIALVIFTVLPPAALWRFWNDPPQSLSESIREARR